MWGGMQIHAHVCTCGGHRPWLFSTLFRVRISQVNGESLQIQLVLLTSLPGGGPASVSCGLGLQAACHTQPLWVAGTEDSSLHI